MHLRNVLSLGLAAGVLAALSAVSASAQTFASFLYDGTGNVVYDNATGSLNGSGIAVQFTFNPAGFGPGLQQPSGGPSVGFGNIAATLSVTGHKTGPAVGSPNAAQPYVIDSFSILRVGDNANLLSGSAAPAALSGTVGGTTLSLTSSLPPAGTSINYNSAFVTFPFPVNASLAWAFTEPSPGGIPINVAGNGNYQQGASATVLLNPAGNFTFVPSSVPEPGAVALLTSMAVCGGVFGIRRLRRSK